MCPPRHDLREIIEFRLCLRPCANGRLAPNREHEIVPGDARDLLKDGSSRRGEWNDMRLAILRASAGEVDGVVLDLTPFQLSDLLAARSSQREKLKRCSKRIAKSSGGVPHLDQLGIGKNAVALSLYSRLVHGGERIDVD